MKFEFWYTILSRNFEISWKKTQFQNWFNRSKLVLMPSRDRAVNWFFGNQIVVGITIYKIDLQTWLSLNQSLKTYSYSLIIILILKCQFFKSSGLKCNKVYKNETEREILNSNKIFLISKLFPGILKLNLYFFFTSELERGGFIYLNYKPEFYVSITGTLVNL